MKKFVLSVPFVIKNFIEIKIYIFYRSLNLFLFKVYTRRLVIHLNQMGRTASKENHGSLKY